jgi:hypothetical protein
MERHIISPTTRDDDLFFNVGDDVCLRIAKDRNCECVLRVSLSILKGGFCQILERTARFDAPTP